MIKNEIQSKLESIVNDEIIELRKVLSKWHESHPGKKSLDFGDINTALSFSLYDEWNEVLSYWLKRIEITHEGYCLVFNNINVPFNEDQNETILLDEDEDRWRFIPGSIDRLTNEIRKRVEPISSMYELSDAQKDAVDKFRAAMCALNKNHVGLLRDRDYGNLYFYNENEIGEILNSSCPYDEIKQSDGKIVLDELESYPFGEPYDFVGSNDILYANVKKPNEESK